MSFLQRLSTCRSNRIVVPVAVAAAVLLILVGPSA
jgi:hypothetical protein